MSEGNQHAEAMDNLFELLTRFGYCQALLYKAWVEASSEIESTVVKKKDINNNNTEESNSLYIDTFERRVIIAFDRLALGDRFQIAEGHLVLGLDP